MVLTHVRCCDMSNFEQRTLHKGQKRQSLAGASKYKAVVLSKEDSCQRQSLAGAGTPSSAGRICRKDGLEWSARGFKYPGRSEFHASRREWK